MLSRAVPLVGLVLLLAASCQAKPVPLSDGLKEDRKALLALQAAVAANGFGDSKVGSWKILGELGLQAIK
jgi:hypothetical protein